MSTIIWIIIITVVGIIAFVVWDRAKGRVPIVDAVPTKCPGCGCGCSEQAHFCPGCGQLLPVAAGLNFCSGCGGELVVGAVYCPDCGKHVIKEHPVETAVESRTSRYLAVLLLSLLSYLVFGYAAWFLAGISAVFLAERIATVYFLKGEYPTRWRVYTGAAIFLIGLSCGFVGSFIYRYDYYGFLFGSRGYGLGWSITAISGAFLAERVVAHNMKGKYPFKWKTYSITTRYAVICLTGLSYGIYNSVMYGDVVTTGIVWFITALCAILLAESVIAYRKTGGDASKWEVYSDIAKYARRCIIALAIVAVVVAIGYGIAVLVMWTMW
ncbi:hypothetical protein ACFLVP_02015 [Chloroflexota bacterium]